jgi:hypothetical protein
MSQGCATPAEQPPAAAAQTQAQERCYASGSRLPSADCGGSSTVGGQSRDDYNHDRASSPTGMQR